MNSLLEVEIYYKREKIFIFSSIELDIKAYTTLRKFILSGMIFKKETLILEGYRTIRIRVLAKRFSNEKYPIADFKFKILSSEPYNILSVHKDFEIFGGVIDTFEDFGYDQALVNIFQLWSKGEDVLWENINNQHTKYSYIEACKIWHYEPEIPKDRKIIIDCRYITEEVDLFYYLSLNLIGKRAYIGNSIYTFEDRIDYYKNKNNSFVDREIIFENFQTLNEFNLTFFVDECINYLRKKGFDILVPPDNYGFSK